jgi:hypothetical protein
VLRLHAGPGRVNMIVCPGDLSAAAADRLADRRPAGRALLALLARLPARIGGRRRRAVVESELRTAVAGVAEELVLAPVAAERSSA